jgi:DNA-directed RNA polymerase specialized sigma24 family protein
LAWKITAKSDELAARKRGGSGIRKRHRHRPPSDGSTDGPRSRPATVIPSDDFDLFESKLPHVDVIATSIEVTERLIGLLQPDQKSVVYMRLDGRTISYMAATLGVSTRSVDRMLESIRETWASSGLLDGIRPGNGPPGRSS